jgi:hypothetical protein
MTDGSLLPVGVWTHTQSAAGKVVEELLQASCGGLVSPDFPLPPALVGVGDELVLAVESGRSPRDEGWRR